MGISPAGTPPGTFKNRKTLPVTTEIFSIDHVCPLTTRRRAVCVNRENGIPVFFLIRYFLTRFSKIHALGASDPIRACSAYGRFFRTRHRVSGESA